MIARQADFVVKSGLMNKLNLKQNKIAVYLQAVRTEMSKVDWPTREQTLRLTLIVIGVTLTAAAFIASFDFVFAKLITLLLKR